VGLSHASGIAAYPVRRTPGSERPPIARPRAARAPRGPRPRLVPDMMTLAVTGGRCLDGRRMAPIGRTSPLPIQSGKVRNPAKLDPRTGYQASDFHTSTLQRLGHMGSMAKPDLMKGWMPGLAVGARRGGFMRMWRSPAALQAYRSMVRDALCLKEIRRVCFRWPGDASSARPLQGLKHHRVDLRRRFTVANSAQRRLSRGAKIPGSSPATWSERRA